MLAVVHRVLRTFCSAGVADVRTKRTHRLHILVAACDRRCGQSANISAFHIPCDALCHRFWIVLLKTGRCTLKAGRRTRIASAKAFDFRWTHHGFSRGVTDIRHPHFHHPAANTLFASEQSVESIATSGSACPKPAYGLCAATSIWPAFSLSYFWETLLFALVIHPHFWNIAAPSGDFKKSMNCCAAGL